MTTWVVATDCVGGVIGLNGIQYALDENGKTIEFETEQDGITFLSENDIDLNDESIWVEEIKTSYERKANVINRIFNPNSLYQ